MVGERVYSTLNNLRQIEIMTPAELLWDRRGRMSKIKENDLKEIRRASAT